MPRRFAPAGHQHGRWLDTSTADISNLEELAYHYGTDKSHDDHKYSDLCISICGASNLD